MPPDRGRSLAHVTELELERRRLLEYCRPGTGRLQEPCTVLLGPFRRSRPAPKEQELWWTPIINTYRWRTWTPRR